MAKPQSDIFNAYRTLNATQNSVNYYALSALDDAGIANTSTLPCSIKILLESLLRNADGQIITQQHITQLAQWNPANLTPAEIPFNPARVLLQDFTGVPAVVDLAACRDACKRLGGNPKRINPLVPCDLVIDHSVQVDHFGSPDSLNANMQLEFTRNHQRYQFLKWGQHAFDNFTVIPPGTGIIHQINLEYLAQCVTLKNNVAFPDSVVGTDSHTTMINSLGVLGWGVGGIEAEAVMLGQPIYMLTPSVVGFKLTGQLPQNATATDAVLTITQLLRQLGVVGQFVEFHGPGLTSLSLPDRATIANMAPEYGATTGFFPVDQITIQYMKLTGRTPQQLDLVERYCKTQNLWRDDSNSPTYSRTAELDLSTVEPSLAGPKRPQDRIRLADMKSAWQNQLTTSFNKSPDDLSSLGIDVEFNNTHFKLNHGSIVIASITSCTNTSNPSVMLAAGLLAKNAVKKGLTTKPWVKTSLAPGSRTVTDYYKAADLDKYLDQLGFNTVGYGCATCIGNSGPLPTPITDAITKNQLIATAVLSGNRNFEGRISPHVKANYLASPPLVIAYAIAGTTDIDLTADPLATDHDGNDVYLSDIWPTADQINHAVASSVKASQFTKRYANVERGTKDWQAVNSIDTELYQWDENSTYIRNPPFFENMTLDVVPITPITDARCLAMLSHSVTTDHISPAGAFHPDSPAGQWLTQHNVAPKDFNSFGSRRGNHEIMMRGTFANIRVRNQLAPNTEGGYTTYLPTNEQTSIYDAAMRYKQDATPLIVLAGKDYGMGSSRDWAAKGAYLLGVKAVIAESFERIHRSNLVGMGILPLQYKPSQTRESLNLTGHEIFTINIDDNLKPLQDVTVIAANPDTNQSTTFTVTCRIDTPIEIDYYRNGGILHTILRRIANEK